MDDDVRISPDDGTAACVALADQWLASVREYLSDAATVDCADYLCSLADMMDAMGVPDPPGPVPESTLALARAWPATQVVEIACDFAELIRAQGISPATAKIAFAQRDVRCGGTLISTLLAVEHPSEALVGFSLALAAQCCVACRVSIGGSLAATLMIGGVASTTVRQIVTDFHARLSP